MRKSLVLLSLAGLGAFAAQAAVDPAWQQAVDQYVSAAKQEVGVFHHQIDAAPADQAKQYQDAKADVAKCDHLVDEMGKSDPQHFDALKGRYEKERAQLVIDLRQAQGTS